MNEKCAINKNDQFGRFIIASSDIKAGELLIEENPIIIGPYWDSKLCCLNCYTESLKMCKICKIAPLCCDCNEHESFECEFLRTSNVSGNFLINHFDVITPLRCLLLYENVNTRPAYENLLKMESHCKLRKGTAIWQLHTINIWMPLEISGLLTKFSQPINEELIQKLCGILDVNTFEIRTPTFEEFPVRGLYLNASLLVHDCCCNTFITLDNNKHMKIFASINIEQNEKINNNYTSALYGTTERRNHLLKGKYFNCMCKRCLDPTEFQTHLSSIKCNKCYESENEKTKNDNFPNFNKSLMTFNVNENHWQCEKCKNIQSNTIIENIIRNARIDINHNVIVDDGGDDINGIEICKQLETSIFKYSYILNPNHSIVIELKQKLAAIIRSILATSDFMLNDNYLEKLFLTKIKICSEMLPILKIVHPGISRLTGIALFELFTPKYNLSKMKYCKQLINAKEYLENLLEQEQLAKESIGILIYEPIDSPEGHLAKRAMFHLKQIRIAIEQMKIVNQIQKIP